ncbi:PAS domain S-box protein [Alteromonas facilis]|uniref:PAS domain-containing hybrid sensor histidine kinase/response regulator n=1 Tax=Alteromonas facilis TaxID=2048004 RepID=UPI000C291C70|nr:PAS domain S-box protein [Alteromonas facilis]
MSSQELDLRSEIEQLRIQLKSTKAENAKYKKLFEVSGDALSIIDLETGRFIECNQSAVNLHGVKSKNNFLLLTPADISPEYQPCGRTSQEMASEYISRAFKEGPQLFDWVHSRLDGSTFQCLVSLTAFVSGNERLILAIGRDISELMLANDNLDTANLEIEKIKLAYLKEKEKFEEFVNLAPVGIAINRLSDGSFDYVNQELSRFSGYGIDELNKMDYWQLTPKKYERQEQEQLESLLETGRYGPYFKEYIHKTGYTYPVQLSGVKITNTSGEEFICSVIQDISQQKAIEEKLRQAKAEAETSSLRTKLANDSAEIGIWEWDVITNQLVWDEWMYKLYGISEDSFSGAYEAWEQCVHPEDIEKSKQLLADAVKGIATFDPEFRVVHPDGQVRTIKASAEVIRNENEQAVKVIGVNYDITEKVNVIRELESAKLVAEQANKAKSEFLANMSHEIRTPMNAILGGLQLVNRAKLDTKSAIMLENALSSASSLLTIINDILDYSKIEDNKLDLELEPFAMLEVLKSVEFEVNSIVSNKGIQLISRVDDNFIDGWLGDIVRVKQILLNLVSNAVKFTDKGSVNINLSTIESSGIDSVCIDVVDTGIGMSKEAQEKIFERFSQADSSMTRRFGGTGLGMSITLSLIHMMQGTIQVKSKANKGTAIRVVLPLKKTNEKARAATQKTLMAPKLNGKRVLIAEDNEINQVIIQSMLEDTNAELITVDNGKLAVELAKKERFDLILMDIQMPIMDGVTAMKEIKKLSNAAPIVALTANAMLEDVSNYLEHGFTAHIGKPIDMATLYGLLASLFDKSTD